MNDKPTPAKAVALRYEGKGAPRVIAKGSGEVAKQILALAETHDIPLHEDRELVLLLSRIELGQEIPEGLYLAVAQILAFIYSLSGKRITPSPDASAPPNINKR